METHQAPEYLHKFFNNLVELKAFIRKKHLETQNNDIKEIYDRLHVIFNASKEDKS